MNSDQFKCLAFVYGLQSHSAILVDDLNQTINKLVTSAQRLINLKRNTIIMEESTTVAFNAINKNQISKIKTR